jgi:hypothetical protein
VFLVLSHPQSKINVFFWFRSLLGPWKSKTTVAITLQQKFGLWIYFYFSPPDVSIECWISSFLINSGDTKCRHLPLCEYLLKLDLSIDPVVYVLYKAMSGNKPLMFFYRTMSSQNLLLGAFY